MTANVIRLSDRPTDGDLVEDARRGDVTAKAELYRRYSRMVANTALRILGQDQDLDDVIQDTFTKALATLDRLGDPQAFAAWLRRIVVGCCVDCIRRRRFLGRIGMLRPAPIQPDELIARSAPPDVAAELEMIYRLVETLPAKERVVLVLQRVERLTLNEIANATGMSISTVKRKVQLADRRLASRRRSGRRKGGGR